MSTLSAGGLAILAGVLVAVQASILGVFDRYVHPLSGALWVHVAGLVLALVLVGLSPVGWGLSGVRAYPWGLVAGVCGVGIVASVGAAVRPLGIGTTVVLVTATQLVLALALDAVGATGRVVPLTPLRVAGVGLVILGAVLIFGRTSPPA